MQTLSDAELAKINTLSAQIGDLFKAGKREEAENLKQGIADIKATNESYLSQLKDAESQLEDLLFTVPNIPHESVPLGNTDEDNEVHQAWGKELPVVDGKPHWDLGTQYNILDFELGNKITGAGFPVFRGKGSRLQRALINFFLDESTGAGYEEIVPLYTLLP